MLFLRRRPQGPGGGKDVNDEWTVERPLSFKLARSSFGEPGQVETLPSISGPEDGTGLFCNPKGIAA